MKGSQAPPIPRSLVRLGGRAIATYDVATFLNTRALDRGGWAAGPYAHDRKRKDRRVEIALAVAILATPSLLVVLLLKVLFP